MKKLLTLLLAFALAFSFTMPTFAKKGEKNKESAVTTGGKAHQKHAKKKGATKGKKQGQQGTSPAENKK
jgi:hypothetical protein